MNLLQRKLLQSLTCCLFLLLLFSLPAHSATDNNAAWEFHVAPYAWIAGLDGTVSTRRRNRES